MKYSDTMMIRDYKRVESFLKSNKKNLRVINDRITKLRNNISDSSINLLIDDVEFIVMSFEMYYIACKNRKGLSQNFFNLTTFKRAIIMNVLIVFEKVKIMNDKNKSNKNIMGYYKEVQKYADDIRYIRNEIEHAIDPHYRNEIENIDKKFNLDNQVEFVSCVVDFIDIYILEKKEVNIRTASIVESKFENEYYKEKLQEKLYDSQIVFRNLNAISYEFEEFRNQSEAEIIVDVLLKMVEYQNAFKEILDENDEVRGHYLSRTINKKVYFQKIALNICYQIFDKLGFYINDRYDMKIQKSYYKVVMDKLVMRDIKNDIIANKIFQLNRNNSYKKISDLRNKWKHKFTKIEFNDISYDLNNLLIENYCNLIEVIKIISDEFISKNNIPVTDEIIEEALSKQSYIEI